MCSVAGVRTIGTVTVPPLYSPAAVKTRGVSRSPAPGPMAGAWAVTVRVEPARVMVTCRVAGGVSAATAAASHGQPSCRGRARCHCLPWQTRSVWQGHEGQSGWAGATHCEPSSSCGY